MKDKFEKSQKNEAITVHGEKKTFETYKKNNKGHKYVFVKLSEYKKLVGSTHKKMRGGDMSLSVTTQNIDGHNVTDKKFIVKKFKEGDKDKYEVVPIPSGFGDNDKKTFISKYLEQSPIGEVYLLNNLNNLCEFIKTNETGNATVPVVAAPATTASTKHITTLKPLPPSP